MQVNYFHPEQEIRRSEYKTQHIECNHQVVIGTHIGSYRYIAGHQAVEMRTIPADKPLTEHQHKQPGHKHSHEEEHTGHISISSSSVEQ